jgi:hypothetical protein
MDLDVVDVRGGEIVRLELSVDGPVEIGERLPSTTGVVESWSTSTTAGRAVLVRPALLTRAIVARRGVIVRAEIGHASNPGFYWFDLEDRVLAWAAGPLRAPFPHIAPLGRIDFDAFEALDRALEEAVAHAKNVDVAADAARAIRRVAGLRAVRALRPPSGYPFFHDAVLQPLARARDIDGHAAYAVSPGSPLELLAAGPTVLHVWAQATLGEGPESPELRILEGDRERAATGTTLPRATFTSAYEPAMVDGSLLVRLRRAVVHVPPGRHRYRLESRGARVVYVAPLIARPIVHLGDALARVKSEEAQLATARRACLDADAPSLCALALALLGEDREPVAAGASGSLSWHAAMAAASPLARDAAESLARGGPRDPTIALETAASRGDPAALSRLGSLVLESIDDATRDAWEQAMARGTKWTVAAAEQGAETWTALAFEDRPDGPACGTGPVAGWPEVGRDDVEIPSNRWHGARAIELVATMPCDAAKPVELIVDGEPLLANPSAEIRKWHVRVKTETARIRRIDDGPGRVYAIPPEMAACGARWEAVRAPHLASTSPRLAFDPGTHAPGIEIWVREGATFGEVRVDPAYSTRAPVAGVRVVARASGGPRAYDDHGRRWMRAARAALPAWASGGVLVRGGDDTAVRALVRSPRGEDPVPPQPSVSLPAPPAEPLDESALVALSREILSTAPPGRGPLYLRRALLLAAGGAEPAAAEDGHAARAFSASGPAGEDAVDLVRASMRRRPYSIAPLPSTVSAYGIEPDFDADARRCAPGRAGIRAALQRALDETPDAGKDGAYDQARATRTLAAVLEAPLDPRGDSLAARVVAGSRWRWLAKPAGARLVTRERTRHPQAPIDGGGELRPHVITGEPFERGTYATIFPSRPARAVLARAPSRAEARLDVSCVARAAGEARGETCPLEIALGASAPVRLDVRSDGTASIPLPPRAGSRPSQVGIALPRSPGRWVALARIVFDREVPHSQHIANVGWVLDPPHVEPRYELEQGESLSIDRPAAGLIRIDAVGAGGDDDEVVAVVGGRTRSLPVDGSQIVLPMTEAGRVQVKATRGSASIAIAERVEDDDAIGADDGRDAETDEPEAPASQASGESPGLPLVAAPGTSTDGSAPRWLDRAERSPNPLTPLQAALGTVVVATGATYGTIRTGLPSASSPDAYVSEALGYRRRIESIGLWTDLEAFGRARSGGEPSYGANAILYEEMEKLHVRLSGSLGSAAQRVQDQLVQTWNPHAFAEYSWRATRDFFVLPRVGYDGVYTSPHLRVNNLSLVDDSVYNAYRVKRPTFLFGQALLWFAPHFNDIFYMRDRISFDPLSGGVSHVAIRPGYFLAFGDLDVSGYLDNTWYAPTDSIAKRARIDELAGLTAMYGLWSGIGSLNVQLGATGLARIDDGGWQVNVFANVLGSYRRGLRDFSSLELDFPEQLGGGIPWRGALPGDYR